MGSAGNSDTGALTDTGNATSTGLNVGSTGKAGNTSIDVVGLPGSASTAD